MRRGLLTLMLLRLATAASALTPADLLGGGRLVAYSPAEFDPARAAEPSRARALRADADLLHRAGFRAVTTYGVSRALKPVCRFFKRRGFGVVLVGIWDPNDRVEMRRAMRLRRCATGYVVGNEGLTFGRYTRAVLDAAVAEVRQTTGRPTTTRETPGPYAQDPTLLALGDWVFANLHPWYANQADPQQACDWTTAAYADLVARAPVGTPVVIGETGLPTAGAPAASPQAQQAFFACLEARGAPFAFFEAYDQGWKRDDAVAPHWGLFAGDRTPKLWAATMLAATRRR